MKHLLDTRELTREEAIEILDVADYMAQVKAENRTLNVLNGKTVVNLFFEDSTRTRLSFEAAEKRLGAAVTNFSASGSSVSKGESLKDTAQTLKAIAADAFVIRHSASGAPQRLAEARLDRYPRTQRGRRHPRTPHPGTARRRIPAPVQGRTRRPRQPPRHRPVRHACAHRRRHPALARGTLQPLAADHPRRAGRLRCAADPAATEHRLLG